MNILVIRICSSVSGAEKYNYLLFDKLRSAKYRFYLLTNFEKFSKEASDLGVKTITVPQLSMEIGTHSQLVKLLFTFPLYLFLYYINLRKLMGGKRINLICLQSMTEKILLTPILKLAGYKVIWIEHGPLFITPRSKVIKLLYSIVSRFSRKILAVSEGTKKDLINGGVSPDKILYIPIGIDVEHFEPFKPEKKNNLRKTMNFEANDIIITFIGSITKEKGIHTFFQVATKLIQTRKDLSLHFLIVGSGPLINYLRGKIKSVNLEERVTVVGYTDKVRDFLGISDIVIFPSNHQEGLSIALLESLSMGLPVVASDIGGNRELIEDGKNGILIHSGSLREYLKAVEMILNDSAKRREIGDRARRFIISRFNINKKRIGFMRLFNLYEG